MVLPIFSRPMEVLGDTLKLGVAQATSAAWRWPSQPDSSSVPTTAVACSASPAPLTAALSAAPCSLLKVKVFETHRSVSGGESSDAFGFDPKVGQDGGDLRGISRR